MKKLIPFSILFLLLCIFAFFLAQEFLPLIDQENPQNLDAIVEKNTYYLAFLIALSCLIVVNTPFTFLFLVKILSGFLFGIALGTLVNVIGTTVGCIIGYYISKYFIKDAFAKRYKKKLEKFNKELEEHGINYLIFARSMLLIPYFIINYFSGISSISLKKYIIGTFLGVLLPSFIYAYIGSQLGEVSSFQSLLSVEIYAIIILYGIFSLTPVAYKKIQKRRLKLS